mgnify:CR=1 FL=1
MAIPTIINEDEDLRTRIRFLSGVKSNEVTNDDLDIAISIAIEWFAEQTGLTYSTSTSDAAYDNAIMYYSCYLACIAQNGLGIEQIRIGDVFVQDNDEEPYNKFLEMANDSIMAKQGLSIQTTSYNADATQGDVDWKKNIDGSDSTLNIRQKPRGM